jgi:nitrogenase molybdenum-iron protein alpha chain
MTALDKAGYKFKEYDGLAIDMDKGTLIIDDINQYEAEKLVELMKPDLFCAGIKEKYSIQKLGVPMKQLHSYDSGGPYAGFIGAVNFYEEIDRLVNSKVWSHMKAPWQKNPQLSGSFNWE